MASITASKHLIGKHSCIIDFASETKLLIGFSFRTSKNCVPVWLYLKDNLDKLCTMNLIRINLLQRREITLNRNYLFVCCLVFGKCRRLYNWNLRKRENIDKFM